MQVACAIKERGELTVTLSGPLSINRNHERERSACLRGAADYYQVLVKEGVNTTEILRRLQEQFGDNTLSRTRVFVWHKEFSGGREKVENESHDRQGAFHVDFLHDRRTINAQRYCELLDAAKLSFRRKRKNQSARSVILLHDNSRGLLRLTA